MVHTSEGITGEYVGVSGPALAEIMVISEYLIGKNPLEREQIYNDTKRGLRHYSMLGTGIIDICLWDIAGKLYQQPIWRLLGGQKKNYHVMHLHCMEMRMAVCQPLMIL